MSLEDREMLSAYRVGSAPNSYSPRLTPKILSSGSRATMEGMMPDSRKKSDPRMYPEVKMTIVGYGHEKRIITNDKELSEKRATNC